MFGYVTPCKMELKIKDYERFKAYYCGLCYSIKYNLGNLPRMALNFDMTFLAILLDALDPSPTEFSTIRCALHPLKKKIIVKDKATIKYAAFINAILAYYKLLDNVNDDNSLKSKLYSSVLKKYFKSMPDILIKNKGEIENKLTTLYSLEKEYNGNSIDELSHPFADLTGFIISSYYEDTNHETLYWLGYNLGKWIYIIDAYDDLEEDMKNNKFNAVNKVFNPANLNFIDFKREISTRIDFILTTCAQQTLSYLNNLPIKKNKNILFNILQLGLMDKMDKVFKRSVCDYEKSI